MIISDVIQLSDEWFAEHAGVPGASSMDKIITSTGKRSTQRKDYLYRLTAEALLGVRDPGYTNPIMDEGTAREDESRSLFAFHYDVDILLVGMCYKDKQKKYLCSPDGLIDIDGEIVAGLEMKNPLAKTHVSYLDKGKLPTKYFVQVQTSLFITELPKWYFFSYYPGLDPLTIEVFPDLEFHEKLNSELNSFCSELAQMIARLRK